MPYQLLIFEDNTRLRQSLEILLNDDAIFQVVGSFSNCNNALVEVDKSRAELVVMDIDMPGISGVEGVKQIKNCFPNVKIVMHTVFDDDNRIFESICAGADGYLLKNTSPIQLIESLQDVMHGGSPMSPFVAKKIFQHFRNQPLKQNEQFNLSEREKEILELLVQGNSYKMIAAKCTIANDTVKKHLHNIYAKLHVSSGTEAVAKALQNNISNNPKNKEVITPAILVEKTIDKQLKGNNRIALPSKNEIEYEETKNILYIEASGSYSKIFFINRAEILLSQSIAELEAQIFDDNFFRLHNSYFVNLAHVKKYVRGESGYVIMQNNNHLNVSRSKKEELLQKMVSTAH
jgi:DNA-binding NarL/FixJ family response regulator